MASRKRKRRKAEKPEVPMSAMIDVVFLLLVYFVTTFKPQVVEAHMAINLPAPDSAPNPANTATPVEVIVLENGQYRLGEKSVTLEVLEEKLVGIASFDPSLTIVIKVDKQAREVDLVNLLDLCARAKLENLNVLTLL